MENYNVAASLDSISMSMIDNTWLSAFTFIRSK